MKYKGPCLDCGQYKDQQYIHKRCISCYQKFHRYNPEFEPRKKYSGPCVFCGSYESKEGRFIRKMCSNCYGRFKYKGKADYEEINKYPGPCIICGSYEVGYAKYFQEKMCSKCYRHYSYTKEHPKKQAYCIDCGAAIQTKRHITKKKRCPNCYIKWKRKTNQSFADKERKRLNKYYSTEKGKETMRNIVRRRRAKLAQVENTLTIQEWKEILNQHNYKCVYCGSTEKIEMDHVIPISKGGSHTKQNVVPACRSCNNKKGNKIIS